MKEPTFDSDGYPTEETLQFIKKYQDIHNLRFLAEFIVKAWYWPDYAKWDDKSEVFPSTLELHTGGWSGNEILISALQESESLFWTFYWQKSERGGHYYFEIPRTKAERAAGRVNG